MIDSEQQNDILRVVIERRSIRRYRPEAIARSLIEHILTAAMWAPSAHNRQPWRFAVVQGEQRLCLAQAMGTRLRHDLAADGVDANVIEADAARSYSRMTAAPVLIVLCLSMVDMDHYPDERRNRAEYLMAAQSTAMAGQNLLLVAHSVGLAACWMCAPLFCPEVVTDVLALPEDWQPQALITLGYPAETREKSRKPLESSVIWR
ncbi:MAG: nitroreductase family protein [Anaerolineae bacterium]|nr:nitroreductase family protein [Anaerolineae bacterium]